MKKNIYWILFWTLILACNSAFSQQNFLHAEGKEIVNGKGENVLLRGMGLGGWMLQEGYMLETSEFANTQYEIEEKIEALIGFEAKELFYDAWYKNYITKADVDSMAAWGFNSIRLPMHYKLFTLPIEEEQKKGTDTWLDKGFKMIDELLTWCEANQMYLILDLHAAPGGQGKDAAISDYNESKPSLWESAENQRKTIALWKKLAERYSNEPWIGGYDLLNETNWEMNGNIQLKNIYLDITKAIREVDSKHIIFIEGNWFANDFTGLTPPWDDNMVYSFHKYWSYNNQGSIQWVLDMREKYNVPLWLGESGENSNTWFTNAINLVEQNNIGWAWWPYKKIASVVGTLTIPKTEGYNNLLNYWKGNNSKPNSADAEDWLMEQVEQLKLENCVIHYDVLDAMFRQAQGDKTSKPFKKHSIPGTIFATDYDYGANGFAYLDKDTGNYQVSTDEYISWNTGWAYRNDGVDIEICTDGTTNGYNVGWTNNGEWLNYTVEVEEDAAYTFELRYAANNSTGQFYLELDGVRCTITKYLQTTGGWTSWSNYTTDKVVLKKGRHQLKFVIKNSGFNLNYFTFSNPIPLSKIEPQIIHLQTDENGKYIKVISNLGFKENSIPNVADFTFEKNGNKVAIRNVKIDSSNNKVLLLESESDFIKSDQLKLSYTNTSLRSIYDDPYSVFSKKEVENLAPDYIRLPALIEAENFILNNGFELENCTDTGYGKNLSYANPGDYADYQVYNAGAGNFEINYRVASSISGKFEMRLVVDETETKLHQITVSTGGWQTWQTKSENLTLPAGMVTLRLFVLSGEFNLNWFQIRWPTAINKIDLGTSNFIISRQPDNSLKLINEGNSIKSAQLFCYDLQGRKVFDEELEFKGNGTVLLSNRINQKGIYIFQMCSSEGISFQKLWVN